MFNASKMSADRKDFDENKYMSFFMKNDKLLEKYSGIWDKAGILLKKDLIVNLFTMNTI